MILSPTGSPLLSHISSVHVTSQPAGFPALSDISSVHLASQGDGRAPSSPSGSAEHDAAAPEQRVVLVVDDDEEMRLAVRDILNDAGWVVREARDGEEAIQQVLDARPDLLLLDHRMPGLTGVEVCEHLQARGISLPVLLITAARAAEALASRAGVAGFLVKPFGMDDLLDAVARIMAARGG